MTRQTFTTRYLSARKTGFELVAMSGSGMRYPLHTHVSTVAVLLVRKGSIRLADNGANRTLRPGDAALIGPHRPHAFRSLGRAEVLVVCLDASLFRAAAGRRSANVRAMFEESVRRGLLLREECEAAAVLLAKAAPLPEERPDGVSILRQTLETHPETTMSLADMAAIAHAGKTHLIRKFKRRYGLTPRRFLTQSRLRKARRELMNAGTLTGAALRAGFFDQSHFIRHFKEYHGITPGQYLASRAPL